MMRSNIKSGGETYQTAIASHTSTAAETSFTSANATLPNGAVGKPVNIKCSGSITGLVQITYGAGATKAVPVIPNGSPVDLKIPAGSYPNPVNQITVDFECTGGVGTLIAVVEFAKS